MFTKKLLRSSCKPGSTLIGSVLLVGSVLLGGLMLAVPGHAQVCVDSDGDGWGWDGSNSCRVSSAAPAVPAASGSAACIDSDGDGYGWNGTATCLVDSQAPSTGSVVSTGSGNGGGSAGACVDSDGDGWGWDGVASCRVGAGGAAAAPAPAPASNQNPPQAQAAPQQPAITNGSFDAQRDLIALHFDHAPDRDDGHAAVAALMVRERLQLNVQVVAGTYGFYSRDRYVPESEQLMSAVWGSEWLNAHRNFEGTVSAAVNRWTSVLASGGDVWVAEGGPSDFTAEVVRRINDRHTEFNTRQRIHLIQHSDWNEDHALASDLNYARNNTRYIKIDDGNNPNGTADLRFESHNNGDFVSRALSSRYSSEWGVAFNYLSPSDKLDFSDTVELLYILGIGTAAIGDINDFGDFFF